MNKYDIVRINTNKLLQLVKNNNAPDWFQEELMDVISYYMQNIEWLDNAQLQNYSNDCFVGDIDSDNKRHGEGIYVYDDGDIYIGSFVQGQMHGNGFYYHSQSNLIYYGEWEYSKKHGHGFVWGPGYESQGFYQNGKEIRNDYVKDGSGYHPRVPSNDDCGENSNCFSGCIGFVVIIAIIFGVIRYCGACSGNSDNQFTTEKSKPTSTYICTAKKSLRVRREPNTFSEQIGSIISGKEIEVLEINDSFAKIKFENRIGFVCTKYIRQK